MQLHDIANIYIFVMSNCITNICYMFQFYQILPWFLVFFWVHSQPEKGARGAQEAGPGMARSSRLCRRNLPKLLALCTHKS